MNFTLESYNVDAYQFNFSFKQSFKVYRKCKNRFEAVFPTLTPADCDLLLLKSNLKENSAAYVFKKKEEKKEF